LLSAAITLGVSGCAIQPKAFTPDEQAAMTREDLQSMFEEQPPVAEPISLYEAMARAIRFNLDRRVQLMEEALRIGQLEVAKGNLLPQLTVNAGYNARDNYPGSFDDSNNSLEPSSSQDKRYRTADATFTWNVLDFGVSYAQARQQADNVLIAREKRRKVVQNIIQDVRYAYWRALSARKLLPELDRILAQADEALRKLDTLQKLSIESPLVYLRFRKQLLTLMQDMWTLREDLSTARAEFAALINLRPGQSFELVDPPGREQSIPSMDLPIERLEGYALINRPDIREQHYKARVSSEEIRKAMARMLPGVELAVGGNFDSTSFLVNDTWSQLGLRLSWNIFNLFTGQKAVETAEAQHELDDARRRSLQMAVMVQVHLAVQRFKVAKKNYRLARQLNEVEQDILVQTAASEQAEIQTELEVLSAKVAASLAKLSEDISYAELHNAYGRIQSSIGIDPLPASLEQNDLEYIARLIEQREKTWQETEVGSL
jgi:outer membrane protein TolC